MLRNFLGTPNLAASLRWLVAVIAGVALFEGLDRLGSNAAVAERLPAVTSLPGLSPFVTGAVAAWWAGPRAVPALLAAVVAVWTRIGLDRGIGALQGIRLPAEAGAVLLLGFGVPWALMALGGGAAAVLVRRVGRWHTT